MNQKAEFSPVSIFTLIGAGLVFAIAIAILVLLVSCLYEPIANP